MLHEVQYRCLFVYAVFLTAMANYDPNMDNILFSINWPGTGQSKDDLNVVALPDPHENTLIMKTKENEKYKCILPDASDIKTKGNSGESYAGPSALELLKKHFEQSSCSYRIETYWTYELCHGKHLRQYHEEKETGKTPKLQEYFLGIYSSQSEVDGDEFADSTLSKKKKIRTKKIEGLHLPYHELKFLGGTPCDLTGNPRSTLVQYVCNAGSAGEIYDLKEVSTCEYELVVLTSHLCSHPDFKQKKDPVNEIRCVAMDGSPQKPKSLDDLELESLKAKQRNTQSVKDRQPPTYVKTRDTPIGVSTDKQLLKDFFTAELCITGGSGWWKHEFCYGKYVKQFHQDKHGKTEVLLGTWDESNHLRWISEFPSKRPKALGSRKFVSQYYSKGEYCDIASKPRTTEVKLRCTENPQQKHAVGIFLVEPNTCEYILVVESPLFCDILDKADDSGLINTADILQ